MRKTPLINQPRKFERDLGDLEYTARFLDDLAVEIAKIQSDKTGLLETLVQAERVFNTSEIDPLKAFVMIERMKFIIEKVGKE